MPSLLSPAEAVAAGIGGHLSTEALQDAIDEEEAWLARKLGGPLQGERTETFPLSYLRVRSHEVRLQRPALAEGLEVLSDGTDITDTVELRHGGRRVALIVGADRLGSRIEGAWAVTYAPADELEVKRALKLLLGLTLGTQGSGGLQAEIIGSYSYTRAAGSATKIRRSILRDLRGEPEATSLRVLSSVRHGLAGLLDR